MSEKHKIDYNDEFVKETLPYVKKIYKKIIQNAKTINHYNKNNCGSKDNEIIDRYKTIYDSLFDSKSDNNNYSLFDNYKLPGLKSITEYATENTLVFVIILIFISFIFSKFVSMMSVQPLPVNKNILQ